MSDSVRRKSTSVSDVVFLAVGRRPVQRWDATRTAPYSSATVACFHYAYISYRMLCQGSGWRKKPSESKFIVYKTLHNIAKRDAIFCFIQEKFKIGMVFKYLQDFLINKILLETTLFFLRSMDRDWILYKNAPLRRSKVEATFTICCSLFGFWV